VRGLAEDRRSPLARPARAALARLPVPPTGRLHLALLGPVELHRDGVPVDVPAWRRHRVRSLLAHLALHRPVDRERLGDDLWPELDAEAQSRNLRVTLSHLLRVLEPDRGERDASFLVRPHGGNGLLLQGGEWLDVDVWRFDALWAQASDADRAGVPSRALDAMRRAVDLWRGDPAELAQQDWARADVEERRLRLVQMAARAGELLLARDDPDEARRMGQAALGGDPWYERAHHVVVAAHLAAGQHRAARDALGRYRDALAELGLSPTESARKLEPLELTAVTARGR
jgi:DNA-binding SARP family transcriptional activator